MISATPVALMPGSENSSRAVWRIRDRAPRPSERAGAGDTGATVRRSARRPADLLQDRGGGAATHALGALQRFVAAVDHLPRVAPRPQRGGHPRGLRDPPVMQRAAGIPHDSVV